jgi:hypothetical protein
MHITYSSTYSVPALLLQGYGADGTLWEADAVHAHLAVASAGAADTFPPDAVTQMVHPSLDVPFFAIHPCRTADLMRCVLRVEDADAPTRGAGQLDYLTAWWVVIAPLVGLRHGCRLLTDCASGARECGIAAGPAGGPEVGVSSALAQLSLSPSPVALEGDALACALGQLDHARDMQPRVPCVARRGGSRAAGTRRRWRGDDVR